MKRFYKTVDVIPSPQGNEIGYNIVLDGKPIRTPDKQEFICPNMVLAAVIRDEWLAQEEIIRPESMPMTQWVGSLIDRVRPQRAAHEELLLGYIDTDLLCYRAPNDPQSFAIHEAQKKHWDPVLDWFAETCGDRLATTTNLRGVEQSPHVHNFLKRSIRQLSDEELAVLLVITVGAGSLILAYAFLRAQVNIDTAFAASFVEENVKSILYNEELHGKAPDTELRQKSFYNDLVTAQQFLKLCSN